MSTQTKPHPYVRITQYRVPSGLSTPDLFTLSLISEPSNLQEGYLLAKPQVAGKIIIRSWLCNGKVCRGDFASSRIIRIEGLLIRTEKSLYQIVRIPPFDAARSLAAWS